jgi:hypothetical protein
MDGSYVSPFQTTPSATPSVALTFRRQLEPQWAFHQSLEGSYSLFE